jgi:hypothetical protein
MSPVDVAGRELVSQILRDPNLRGAPIRFGAGALRWLLRTHQNMFSLIRETGSGEQYSLSTETLRSVFTGRELDDRSYRIAMEVIAGIPGMFDPDSRFRINITGYRSVRFVSQDIIVSHLRLFALETFLFLPRTPGDTYQLKERVKSCLVEMENELMMRPSIIRAERIKSPRPIVIDAVQEPWDLIRTLRPEMGKAGNTVPSALLNQ